MKKDPLRGLSWFTCPVPTTAARSYTAPSNYLCVNAGPCVGIVLHGQQFFHFYSFNMSCKHKAQTLTLNTFCKGITSS